MRTIMRFLVAAVLTGTVAAPAFAYETALEFQAANTSAQAPHLMKRSARTLHNDALGAMPHEPAAGALLPYDRNLRDFAMCSPSYAGPCLNSQGGRRDQRRPLRAGSKGRNWVDFYRGLLTRYFFMNQSAQPSLQLEVGPVI